MSSSIENDILTMAQKISEYDVSVLFNPLFKKTYIDSYEVKINADCVTISKTLQYDMMTMPRSTGFFDDHLHKFHSPFVTTWNDQDVYNRQMLWYVGFTFNYSGKLLSVYITDSTAKTHSVLIGEKKLFIDDTYWLDIEDFHAKVFQSMTITTQQMFDLSFTSEILKIFNIGD